MPRTNLENEFNNISNANLGNALRKICNPVIDEIGSLFTKIIEIEADLEVTRYDLADMQHFNLYETFRYFDQNSDGYISLF